ncbi:translocation/assembly module TamB domain-containing protein [Flavobacterium sp. RHBU_3]|uniref:translocation/assembly module TamB domain-containing protein n=1 Tax=Flavobacterium sp. RHBU_3 TaxID=3391184 RepID=UPI0039850F2A
MENKVKTNSRFKKFKKILLRTLLGLVVFLLLVAIALQVPYVQTQIARYATDRINEDFKTHIFVDKVAINIFGGVRLQKVLIKDHHNDTLISADYIKTNLLSFKKLAKTNLEFGKLNAQSLNVHMKTYKGETVSSLDVFIKSFDDGKPGKGKFRLNVANLYVAGGRFRLSNENAAHTKVLDFTKISGFVKNFLVKGPNIYGDIRKLSLHDHHGLFVQNLTGGFAYTKKNISLRDAEIKTAESELKGNLKFTFERKDLPYFVDKVQTDFDVTRAVVSSNELNYFYPEFGKDQKFYLSTHLKGTLNNFILYNLNLIDDKGTEISGKVNFRNLFTRTGPGFYMNGNFRRITAQYNNLCGILPRILGKKLPEQLGRLGEVDITGHIVLTKTDLTTDMYVLSGLGEATANLEIKGFNNPNEAKYKGVIDLQKFNVGALTDIKQVGLATLHLDVDGKGFNKESLNTSVKGDVTAFAYNGYNYKKVTVDGLFKWPYFKGRVNSNDPNLLMSFDGLVDMSQYRKNYDFHAQVDYADLALLKIMKKDTLSIFKGDLLFEASGNNLNDLAGTLQISRLSYQNSRDSYYFEDFFIASSFDDNNERTVTVNSQDIIEGRVTGKFDVYQVPKIFENGLGSLYANYSPHKVKKGQYLDYDLTIYNKIVGIVLPEISVSKDTHLKGRVNADKNEFVVAFNSPGIIAYDNAFNNVKLDVNNKNPLYNTYVSVDSMRVKNYKISDFSLINVTQHDTLYVRTEFKGGNHDKDAYKLNLYHTIDKDRNSVVGFKKSEVSFKNSMWYINEHDEHNNKIVFKRKIDDFSLDNISLSHNDQHVELSGAIKGNSYKDLRLSFKEVDLNKITPSLDSISFGGRLNGEVSLKQNRDVFEPSASITIDTLRINDFALGDMNTQVTGDRSFRKFNLKSTITRQGDETFSTAGNIEIVDKQTLLSLDAVFTNFDISPLTVFLKSIFPEIRGRASGRAAIVGNVRKPEIDGVLYVKGGGVKVGYLNTDYNFDENSMINLTEDKIIFGNVQLTDTRYKTKALLQGEVRHDLFRNWALDLKMSSDNILVLDTEDHDDALYYGKAFIKGTASISGPTSGLLITADAKSMPNTEINIPISNVGSTSTSTAAFIHFLSPKEKENIQNGQEPTVSTKGFKGLEMQFDLVVTPDAKINVIIDKSSGHGLSSTGNGYMLLGINTLGKFTMDGDYQVDKGKYFFRYGGVIDKEFTVKKGGTINWEGDPTRARLNLEAVYTTNANPAILLETNSFNRPIKTEVVISLQGSLLKPEPDFTINFPGASSVLKSDLDYRLSDTDTRQTQALALLSGGSFISPSNASSAVTGSLFEKASSLFNDIISDGSGKVNVGFNYVQQTRNPYVDTNSQIGITLSSQINDRVSINGQLGVPVGGVNESAITGNIEVKLRINEPGTLNARVFNRENDINFLGEGIGYTQGVGLTYEVDFNTISQLMRKIFGTTEVKKDGNSNNSSDDMPDSELAPDFMQFGDTRKKKTGTDEDRQPDNVPEPDM